MDILRKFPRKSNLKVVLTMLLIVAASIWFAIQSQPEMRRESDRPIPVQGVIVLSLDQALNLSLACGDGRRVNWDEVI